MSEVAPPRNLTPGLCKKIEGDMVKACAEEFGLSPDDFGREFSTGRERFRIAGIDPRRPKYPISATRIPEGEAASSPLRTWLLLQAAIKDVSPKA